MPRRQLYNPNSYLVGEYGSQPKTPNKSPTRRLSTTPKPDGLFSPVSIDVNPIERHELKKEAVDKILKWKAPMCRDMIGFDYIHDLARKKTSEVWTIKDRTGKMFGFAITEVMATFVKLHLVCSVQRKGEGKKLFHNILDYCLLSGMDLKLHPISKHLAEKYLLWATEKNFHVFRNRQRIHAIPGDFKPGVSGEEEELYLKPPRN